MSVSIYQSTQCNICSNIRCDNLKFHTFLKADIQYWLVLKQISKSTACLPQYIDVIHAVGQELLVITEKIVFFLVPG